MGRLPFACWANKKTVQFNGRPLTLVLIGPIVKGPVGVNASIMSFGGTGSLKDAFYSFLGCCLISPTVAL